MNALPLRRLVLSLFCVLAVIAPRAFSQTWIGEGADSNWTNPDNWTIQPANNGTANVVFGESPRLDPNIDTAQHINRLQFSADAGPYVFTGESLTLQSTGQTRTTQSALVNSSTATQTISANIILPMSANITSVYAYAGDLVISGNIALGSRRLLFFNGDTSAATPHDITLSGNISGAGTGGNSLLFHENFTGTARVSGHNTYVNSTVLRGGTVIVQGSQPLGAASSVVEFGVAVAVGGTPTLLTQGAAQVINNMKLFNQTAGAVTLGGSTADVSTYSGNLTLGDTGGKTAILTAAAGGEVWLTGDVLTSSTGSDDNDGLTKNGLGAVVLAGAANTYSGATAVNTGTLLVNGGYAVGGLGFQVASGAALGGSGTINRAVTLNVGSTLIGGDGVLAGTALTVSENLTLGDNTTIQLVLGSGGTHSSLVRTGGIWSFDSDQAFSLAGGEAGEYLGVISGLTGTETGLGSIASWQITSAGYVGTFAYDGGGNVNLTLSQAPIPEPATWALLGLGLLMAAGRKKILPRRR